MEYIGAADYYFWQGVKDGLQAQHKEDPETLTLTFPMDNQTTRACTEAYKWGFCLGQQMTENEYNEILNPIIERKEEAFENEKNVMITGTC